MNSAFWKKYIPFIYPDIRLNILSGNWWKSELIQKGLVTKKAITEGTPGAIWNLRTNPNIMAYFDTNADPGARIRLTPAYCYCLFHVYTRLHSHRISRKMKVSSMSERR